MAVYYKFKSARDYDSIPIEGQFISVANLKERIFESKHLGRGADFDLMISNAQTDEEYADEVTMIPKNTSILIRRIPGRPRRPIVTEPEETKAAEYRVEEVMPAASAFLGDSSMKYPEESEWDDEFGNELYVSDSIPSQSASQAVDASENKVDEDSKIKALIDTSALDYSQIPDGYGAGRGYGRGMGGRMMAGRGFGRGLERRTPPPGYVCHRCKVPGHFIQHCPTNGDTRFDVKRMKPPTGIPKSMLMQTPDGSYALPSGAGAVLKPNEAAFEKEIESLPTTRSVGDLPPELRCPLCKEVMKDAVLTSKCCFRSFCDKCIRDYIINKSICVCGATSILADDLLPNKTLRETISRILEAPPTSSTENVGSMVQVQDMESSLPVQPKVRSPAVSAASKEETKAPTPVEDSPNAESLSGAKATNVDVSSSDKKATTIPDVAEGSTESKNAKEDKPVEVTHVAKGSQEKLPAGEQVKKKKKKKARAPGNAEEQWKNYQDFGAENFAAMPLGPTGGFNPYWGGGVPLPMDYMGAPFPGPMPYMGYPPGPFDPFGGGVLPQDPFMPPGYMMPGVPRDLSELAVNPMGINMGPPVMSREEFDPRKPEYRRREMDRFNERERERDRSWEREREREREKERERERERQCDRSRERERGRDRDHERERERDRDSQREVRESSGANNDNTSMRRKARSRSLPDRSEHAPPPSSSPDRHSRRSPHRSSSSGKKRSSDRYDDLPLPPPPPPPPSRHEPEPAKAPPADAADPRGSKSKASVFSRISFPGDGDPSDAKRSRRASSDKPPAHSSSSKKSAAAAAEDSDARHRRGHQNHREAAAKSAAAEEKRRPVAPSELYGEEEESEEEEEQHFKRRPSSSRREREREKEAHEEPRHSRRSRDHGGGHKRR
ncbi:E3 ubiquitin ligase PARAQUAT TOLERANCE 3-like isoform X2 [Phragmites australis]|uniref:E3 ubiquitin ligase PARAQUAT TOLERANCE 3-like isoform X2 n=1 Tax=Phragmites australis TaxID=29695 RepID=UPI002D768105|nr:E3 ubiquitin ligase PARAQUAT TOLERANCE 3-like isoform X2 [Phragmites australis]